MKPSEALDKAVEVIERDGWTQNVYYLEPQLTLDDYEENIRRDEEAKRSAPCCQQGAIVRALTGTWKSINEMSKPDREIIRATSAYCRQLTDAHPIEWNDAEGRTKEEVVEMLKAAQALAEADGE